MVPTCSTLPAGREDIGSEEEGGDPSLTWVREEGSWGVEGSKKKKQELERTEKEEESKDKRDLPSRRQMARLFQSFMFLLTM